MKRSVVFALVVVAFMCTLFTGTFAQEREANPLALNLAHDIITGKRNVEDARNFYAQTISTLMRGEKSEYTKKLMFSPKRISGDKDKPAMSEAQMREMKNK